MLNVESMESDLKTELPPEPPDAGPRVPLPGVELEDPTVAEHASELLEGFGE